MIILENTDFRVSILDPEEDRRRLGPRFCTGGCIYQVEDRTRGALLSGPEYPAEVPSVINGQGLPDVFQHTLFESAERIEKKKLIIGVGLLDNSAGQKASDMHFALPVESFCRWEINRSAPHALTMVTHQVYGVHALELERTVTLQERTVAVSTRIRNSAAAAMNVRMFSHPFFPRIAGSDSCTPEFSCRLPESTGFFQRGDGSIGLDPAYDWEQGCYQMLEDVQGKFFSMHMRHPITGECAMSADHPITKAALWANDRTFSIEPFIERTIAPAADAAWIVTYRF